MPAPTMSLEVPLGSDREFIRWLHDGFRSLRPQIERLNISLEKLGDLEDLPQRIQSEVEASEAVTSWMGLFGGWCRKPIHVETSTSRRLLGSPEMDSSFASETTQKNKSMHAASRSPRSQARFPRRPSTTPSSAPRPRLPFRLRFTLTARPCSSKRSPRLR